MKKVRVRLLLCLSSYLLGYLVLAQPVRVIIADPGDLDTSFGGDYDEDGTLDGYYLSENGRNAYAVTVDSNGVAFVFGGGCSATTAAVGLVNKFSSVGGLDETLGDEGFVAYDADSSSLYDKSLILAVEKNSSGNFFVTGTTESASGDKNIFISSYSSEGVEDSSFVHTTSIYDSGQDDEGHDLTIDNSGNLIVVGSVFNSTDGFTDLAIVRFSALGVPDTTFDAADTTPNGAVHYSYTSGDAKLLGVAMLTNTDETQDIVAVGYETNESGNKDIVILQVDSTGVEVSAFDTDGHLAYDFSGGDDVAESVYVDSSGNIFVAGYKTDSSSDIDVFVAKYSSAGVLDESFGSSGFAILDSGHGDDKAYAIVADSEGSLLVSGNLTTESDDAFFIARFDSSGSLDDTFGDPDSSGTARKGYATLAPIDSSARQNFYDLTLDSGENILVVGSSEYSETSFVNEKFILAKFEGGYVEVVCGDGDESEGEECDDGNTEDYDGCSSDCEDEVDADDDGAYVGEDCDDNDAEKIANCDTCGDGTKGESEGCDDGNLTAGDGCTAACLVETDSDGDGYYGINDCDDSDATIHVNCPDPSESATEGGGCGCVLTGSRPAANQDVALYGLAMAALWVSRSLRANARRRES